MDDLVRLTLIYENTKTPIRVDDIAKCGRMKHLFFHSSKWLCKGHGSIDQKRKQETECCIWNASCPITLGPSSNLTATRNSCH